MRAPNPIAAERPSLRKKVVSRTVTGFLLALAAGNSISWNIGNMSADRNGNIYNYNSSSGAEKFNSSTDSWQPANKPAASSSSWGGWNGSGWGGSDSLNRSGSWGGSGGGFGNSGGFGGGGGWRR